MMAPMSRTTGPTSTARVPRPRPSFVYSLARALFALTVRAYFRRVEVRDLDRLPCSGPLLIVANHPAGLTDPVVLATSFRRPVHFLAMAPLFRPWLRGVLMRAIGALPLYRKRDDATLMHLNDETFRACHEFLDRGGAVAIFPEGHSDLDRGVMEVRTGAARLALAQVQRGDRAGPFTLLPVGLYFEDRTRFQSEVIVSIGEPIALEPHLALAATEPREAVLDLTRVIQAKLESLIQVIPEPEFRQLVVELEKLYLPELQARGDPRHALELKRRVAACVDHFRRADPERVVAVARQLRHYLRGLRALQLHDESVREVRSKGAWRRTQSRRWSVALAGVGPAFLGAAIHWPPARLCSRLALWLAPHPTAISGAQMIAGFVLFPVWWASLTAVAWKLTAWSVERLVAFGVVLMGLGAFATVYMNWWDRQPDLVRLPLFAARRRRQLLRVAVERRELVRIFDRARHDFLDAERAAGATAPTAGGDTGP